MTLQSLLGLIYPPFNPCCYLLGTRRFFGRYSHLLDLGAICRDRSCKYDLIYGRAPLENLMPLTFTNSLEKPCRSQIEGEILSTIFLSILNCMSSASFTSAVCVLLKLKLRKPVCSDRVQKGTLLEEAHNLIMG